MNRTFWICGWLASVIVAVAVTHILISTPEPLPAPPPEIITVEVERPGETIFLAAPLATGELNDEPEFVHVDQHDVEPSDPTPVTPFEMGENLRMALVSNDLVGQNLVIAHLLANLTLDNVDEALRAFENSARSDMNDHHFRMFMHAWAKLDGAAAFEHMSQWKKHERIKWSDHMAMQGWAETDPVGALDFIEKQKHEGWKKHLQHGLVRGLVRRDVNEAAEFVELQDGKTRDQLTRTLAKNTLEQHGAKAAFDWLERTTARVGNGIIDEAYLGKVYGEVLGNIRPENAQDAASWLDENPNHPEINDWAYQKVSREFVRANPNAAVDWVEGYRVSGNERFNYGVIGNFSGAWARDDPYAAMEWADNMDQASRRSSAYSQIANQWDESDLANAERWLEAGREDPLMDDARRRYSMRIAERDPVRALEYGTQIQNQSYREESLVNAARVLVKQDPEAVNAWLPVSGLSPKAQAQIFAGDG